MSCRYLELASGETFHEPDDWVDFMRKAIRSVAPMPSFGVDARYDYAGPDRMIGLLFDAIEGTEMAAAMADASLSIFEHGTAEEMDAARFTPIVHAPNASERILRLLTTDKRATLGALAVYPLCRALLALLPNAEGPAEIVYREYLGGQSSDLVDFIAESSPRWLAAHLPPPEEQLDPMRWVSRTSGADRKALLDAIEARGADYVERSIATVLLADLHEELRHRYAALFSGHPTFERAIAEGIQKLRA